MNDPVAAFTTTDGPCSYRPGIAMVIHNVGHMTRSEAEGKESANFTLGFMLYNYNDGGSDF
jgi:hypothetical protein